MPACRRCFRSCRRTRPTVVLLNVDVPGLGGLETARRLLRLEPAPRVVGLGASTDGPFPECLLELGASGYLTKDCGQEELVAAVRRVAHGRRYVSADVAQSLAGFQYELTGHLQEPRFRSNLGLKVLGEAHVGINNCRLRPLQAVVPC